MANNRENRNFIPPSKLFIKDVLNLQRDDTNPDVFKFRGRDVKVVDIMGVVTEQKQVYNDCHLYRVDDGTGVIICIYDHYNRRVTENQGHLEDIQNEMGSMRGVHSEIGEAISDLVGKLSKEIAQDVIPLEQGQSAHILGFISDYHGNREIRAFQINSVRSIEDEFDRVYEMSTLYNSLYCTLEVNN